MNRRTKYKFRLYMAQGALNSAQALANLSDICRIHLPGRHHIEVVNVLVEKDRALAEHIRMTPTTIKLSPAPTQRIVGTLSQTKQVLQILGLDSGAT
jgi:circadian clock protein KaiB